ncbi:LCP family protein [Candidatus Acetothermia bacterium]|nr:LCP family protein [Candidatus Acetothermia bacterium]
MGKLAIFFCQEVTVARVRTQRKPRGPLILAALLMLAAGIALISWISGRFSPEVPALPPPRTNILLLGVDNIGSGATAQRSDSIAVVSVKEKDVRVLSVPRDLRIKFPDGTLRKLNAAYASKGPDFARDVISKFLGVPIKYYIVLDYLGFSKLIDLVGGVTVNVPERMKYDDRAQDLHIDIAPGVQHFNGAQALNYVRYRDKNGGDLARIRRHHQLIAAVLQQGVKLNDNQDVTRFVSQAMQFIKTNMSFIEINTLAQPLRGLTPKEVRIQTLGGEPKTSKEYGAYLEPDPVLTEVAVDEMLRGKERLTNDEIRVLTLNGAGKAGIARAMSEYLKKEGFSAERASNADRLDYGKSYIIDIMGQPEKAKKLQQALKSPTVVAKPEDLKNLMVYLNNQGITGSGFDIILVIGKDFVLQE